MIYHWFSLICRGFVIDCKGLFNDFLKNHYFILSKSNKDLLLYLNKKNIKLGTELIIHDIEKFDKSFEVLLEDERKITLTFDACQRLLIEKL